MVAMVSNSNPNPKETLMAIPTLVSRTGRHLQRYHKGHRQVVGCIPYRYRSKSQPQSQSQSVEEEEEEELQVLLITAQKKGKGLLFPKGGWEMDESIKQAALRETVEEAGVLGTIERILGKWSFQSKSQDAFYEGYMFPLLVNQQLDIWPEKHLRQRVWMSVAEAREVCQYWWMKEALDILGRRLTYEKNNSREAVGHSLL